MDDTTREDRNNALGYSGHIRMGCAPTMAKFLLPEIIPSLLRQAPGVTIELNTNISGTLVSLLKEGMLDLALTHVAGPIDGYEVTPLVNDELVIVAGKNHPIFNEPYTVHDLSKYRWLLPRRSATRPWLDAVLAKHNCPPPELQMEATSVLFLPRLIAATNMLSLLSRRNIGDIDDGGFLREVALPETELRRVFCLVYNKTSYLSPAVLRLIDLLLERADSDVPSVEDVGWPVSIR
jgi:DNA-binding transcriptional LysR family regulator